MVNFGPLAAEIVSLVWGTPINFNGFRVLAMLLHSQTAALNRGPHLYSPGRPSRWALAHISSLIYNTNRNVFLWIGIFICTMDLYNATADRWSCHLPNRNVCATQVLPMGVERSVPLRLDIKGTELPPANILIPLERQLIALQPCRRQFLYDETLQQTSCPFFSERELTFTFAICYRPSVCRLSSVTFVRPNQEVQIFRNISMALRTLAIR